MTCYNSLSWNTTIATIKTITIKRKKWIIYKYQVVPTHWVLSEEESV